MNTVLYYYPTVCERATDDGNMVKYAVECYSVLRDQARMMRMQITRGNKGGPRSKNNRA